VSAAQKFEKKKLYLKIKEKIHRFGAFKGRPSRGYLICVRDGIISRVVQLKTKEAGGVHKNENRISLSTK
jgi:hypothetical protein